LTVGQSYKNRFLKNIIDSTPSLLLHLVVLGGVMVTVLPLVPRFAASNPAETMGFKGDKNPQHAFLQRGSKAEGPMS
jgi:hypothetical protein